VATQTRTLPATITNVVFGGAPPWSNLGGAAVCNDASYASAVFTVFPLSTSDFIRFQGYGFAIPGGSVINGIRCRATVHESISGVADDNVLITKLGGFIGVNHALMVEWPLVDSVLTWGGLGDLWGVAWTPANINAATFGWGLTITDLTGVGAGGFVDCTEVTVDFTPPSGAQVLMPIMGIGAPQ
jgi:hypothetical protein